MVKLGVQSIKTERASLTYIYLVIFGSKTKTAYTYSFYAVFICYIIHYAHNIGL